MVDLVSVTEATGETAVADIGQSLSNCLGFASDGAYVVVGNNMCGREHNKNPQTGANEMHL